MSQIAMDIAAVCAAAMSERRSVRRLSIREFRSKQSAIWALNANIAFDYARNCLLI